MHLLLQAYGKKQILDEALFHVLKLLEYHQDIPIVIYTDTPKHFEVVSQYIKFETINQNTIEEWRGPQGFVHRFKIMMILDFFEKYHSDVLYVDSDTYPTRSLNELILLECWRSLCSHVRKFF